MKTGILFLLFMLFARQLCAQNRTLDFYIARAKANPQLLETQNQIQSLSQDSGKLQASYGLQVSANANLYYAPVAGGWGYDNIITNGREIMGVMSVSKQIALGKNNLQTRLNSFSIQKDILNNQSKLTLKSLEQNITQQYIDSYAALQQYELANEIDTFLQMEDVALKKLTQSAIFKQTDYLTFVVALQQQHLVAQQAKAQYLSNVATLNYMCGIEDTDWIALAKPVMEDSALIPFEQTAYYESSLLDSIKNDNDAKIIGLDYKPKLSVFADGGYESSWTTESYKNFGISAGLSFSLPVYDGHQKKMSLLQNELQENSRKNYTDFYRRQYNQQAMQLLQQVNLCEQLIAEAERQLTYSKALIEANRKQLTTGDVHITDYLLSINNYLNLRSGIIQNDMARLSLLNQIQKLILK
jgi:outer membrane protein TolC